MTGISSKAYDIAFKLGAKLDSQYSSAFQKAEQIASKSASRMKNLNNSTAGKLADQNDKAAAQSKKALEKAQEIADKTFNKVKKTIVALSAMVLSTTAITGTVNKAIEFESSMADVAKVVDGLKDSSGRATQAYAAMSDKILDMTAYLPMTGEELAKITASAGQAGIASKDLMKFTENSSKMGIAFDVTAEQAGDWMAQWRTAFKMSQGEVVTLADQINYLSNNTSENATKLSGVVSRIGSLGEVAGLSADKVAAIAASMTGVSEEISATGIKNLMKAMNAGAAATDTQLGVLDRLGYSATDLAKRMQVDAQGAVLDLLKAFQKLEKHEQSASLIQYFGSESVGSIAPLLNNLENLEKNFQRVGDASQYAGSMESEFASRAATTENKIQLAKNAVDRMQISLGNLALPYVAEGANLFSDAMNNLSDHMQQISMTISKGLNKTRTTIMAFWKTSKPFLLFILNNGETVAGGLIAIGVAFKTFKVVPQIIPGFLKLIDCFKALKLMLLGNPYALIIGAIVGALAFLAIKIAAFNAQMKRENLSKHFGDITLSMEELDDVAKRIVHTRNLDKVEESLSAFAELDNIQNSLSETTRTLDKLNWKVSIGLTLSESEKESYTSSITSFIQDSQEVLLQKQYALKLSLDVLTDDNETGQKIRDKVNQFYKNNIDEVSQLGTQLQSAVNDAFSDGLLDIDEQKAITELQNKMATITSALAQSQFEAKLDVLGMNYSGVALTGETYKELQNKINEEVTAAQSSYQEALTLNIANAKVMLNKNAINQQEYNEMISEYKRNYLEDVGEIELKASNFQVNTLLDSYGSELSTIMPQFEQLFNQSVNDMITSINDFGSYRSVNLDVLLQDIGSFKMDKATKSNITDLFNNMKPNLEELQNLKSEYEAAGREVPAAISKGILDISLVGSLVGDTESIFTILNSSLNGQSAEYEALIQSFKERGETLPEEFISGIELKYPEMEGAASALTSSFLNKAQTELSRGITASIPLNVSFASTIGPIAPTGLQGIKGHATGSNYTDSTFIAGEAGAELITNRKGSKVFTALETGNIFNTLNQIPVVLYNKVKGALANSLSVPKVYSPPEVAENPFQLSTANTNSTLEVKYAPTITITINGDADKNQTQDAVMTAIREGYNEIRAIVRDEMEKVKSRKERLSNG